jgi:hypothetical protein
MKAKMIINKCLQDSQDLGGGDDHMNSRVYFTLEIDGKNVGDLYADIKQAVGGEFEKDNIEVYLPEEYKGKLNYEDFRNAVEKYYRSLIGTQGQGIRVSGSSSVHMRNNTFVKEMIFQFNIKDSNLGW